MTKEQNICYCGNYGGGMHTRSARCPGGELGTPQGEPALTSHRELPGTREPVVTAPQGNAGESPASTSSKTDIDLAWRTFLMNSASDRSTWEAFVAAWHAGWAARGPVEAQPAALNLVSHLRAALERIEKHGNHQPPSGLTSDHLVGYWQGRAEGICLEARAALENLPDETSDRIDWKARAEAAQGILSHNMALANATTRKVMEERNAIIRKLRERHSAIDIAEQVGLTRQRVHQILNEAPIPSEEPEAVRAGVSVKDPTPPQEIILCAAMGPSGFICERPKGHPGRHCDGDNQRWSSENGKGDV